MSFAPVLIRSLLQPLRHQFGDVHDLGPAFNLARRRFKHLGAERAAHRHDFRAGLFGFFITGDIDLWPRAVFFFFPELSATRAAAERIFLVPRHFAVLNPQRV